MGREAGEPDEEGSQRGVRAAPSARRGQDKEEFVAKGNNSQRKETKKPKKDKDSKKDSKKK